MNKFIVVSGIVLSSIVLKVSAQTNRLQSTGNVGVGTVNPTFRLQVQKNSSAAAMMIGGGFSGSPRLQIYGLDNDDEAWMGLGTDMGGGPYEHSVYFPSAPNWYAGQGSLTIGDYNGSTYNVRMTVLSNGNVGIGTQVPKEKLSVYGGIRATEIKVESANWPDYVFAKNYLLPTLRETETHIKEKGHLPGIPSALEVAENGISVGDMNARLLKKIEELTLYLIEQDKQMKQIVSKADKNTIELTNKINDLEKRIGK